MRVCAGTSLSLARSRVHDQLPFLSLSPPPSLYTRTLSFTYKQTLSVTPTSTPPIPATDSHTHQILRPLMNARAPLQTLDLSGNRLEVSGANLLSKAVWTGGLNLRVFLCTSVYLCACVCTCAVFYFEKKMMFVCTHLY